MTEKALIQQRLFNQRLSSTTFTTAKEVTDHLGPIQGQDYAGAKWSIGLRCRLNDDAIELAIRNKEIVRTWPLRSTLHFVSSQDVRWILDLIRPVTLKRHASLYRGMGLDEPTFKRAFKIFETIMRNGESVTREELSTALNRKGIATNDARLSFLLYRAGMEKRVCFAVRRGKQFTYALLDYWIPENAMSFTRDEALYELAKRYFLSRGPASLNDFSWWSSLPKVESVRALEMVRPELLEIKIKGLNYYSPPEEVTIKKTKSHLLSGFDEYPLAYADRSSIIDPDYLKKMNQGNAMFQSTIVLNGKVRGFWKRTLKNDSVVLEIQPFAKISLAAKTSINVQAKRYAKFLGLTPHVYWR